MLETALYAYKAIMPITLMIALGYLIKESNRFDNSIFKKINSVCYHYFLPIYIFHNLYSISGLDAINWKATAFIMCSILFSAGVGILVGKKISMNDEDRGVVAQACFRGNQTILGVPISRNLGGDAAASFGAAAIGILTPLLNILSVLVLLMFNNHSMDRGAKIKKALRDILYNPLIIASIIGMAMLAVRALIPRVDGELVFSFEKNFPSLFKGSKDLGSIASPFMLFILGTQLDFASVKSFLKPITLAVLFRLVIIPAFVITAAVLLKDVIGMTTVEAPMIIISSGSPAAVATAVLVQELGGNQQLASQIIVFDSVLSMLTMFVIVFIVRSIGII